jgi:thiamine-monophosphate kinase
MIDLSDGVAADAAHVGRRSGVALEVELEALPRAPGASVEQAAAGGEDFELLACLPPGATPPSGTTAVGRVRDGEPGAVLLGTDGRPVALAGYEHAF